MKCSLCDLQINNYNSDYNHLIIDNTHSVEICQDCVDKFRKWQQSIITRLFPTSAMKKFNKKLLKK
jgi:hypothetical protein